MGALSLSQVTKSFGRTEVIKGVDLEVAEGEFCVFVGPSGCGKSTLLRMIAGLEDVTCGDVNLDGVRINDLAPAKREIAMVFQTYALYPHLTVRDNMGLALKQAGEPRAAIDAAIKAAKADSKRPTLICCRTAIGMGSPNKANSADVHGAPLGGDEIAATRAAIGWTHAAFEIPANVYAAWNARAAGAEREAAWDKIFAAYSKAFPAEAAEFTRRLSGAGAG